MKEMIYHNIDLSILIRTTSILIRAITVRGQASYRTKSHETLVKLFGLNILNIQNNF